MAEVVAKDRSRSVKCTDRDNDLVMQRDKDMDMVHLDRDFNTEVVNTIVYDIPIEFVKLIHGRALKQRNRNLNNVEVILGDITKIELNQKFDRVMVIGVFEIEREKGRGGGGRGQEGGETEGRERREDVDSILKDR
ncbi:hypothetical protein Syun_028363 [Stephania yunnanensis]|uniref:Uncharacterized protein n=1 Tax=Stephania yunnanensis TaxID=152371 RepID=A0AAP0EMG6_9MAGN